MLGVKKDYCLVIFFEEKNTAIPEGYPGGIVKATSALLWLACSSSQIVHITHLIVVERLYLIIYAKINFASNLHSERPIPKRKEKKMALAS
jgi:hypothetical protein